MSGAVFRIYRESEGAVNIGEPLMDIGNGKNLEVRVEVLSSDAVKIKKGTKVLFKRWGSDEPLTGKVRLVEPAGFTKISSLGVEEQRVLVIVDITSPPEKWQCSRRWLPPGSALYCLGRKKYSSGSHQRAFPVGKGLGCVC